MITHVEVVPHEIRPTPEVPNNSRCALLVYPQVLACDSADPAADFERLFAANGWSGSWRNGIYPFHHFHSTAHEVLGIYSGEVRVQFGGENGICVEAGSGDVVVVPAGVAHKELASRGSLGVVGAYPQGQIADMCLVAEVDLARAKSNVARVPLPEHDPVYGADGPLLRHWSG